MSIAGYKFDIIINVEPIVLWYVATDVLFYYWHHMVLLTVLVLHWLDVNTYLPDYSFFASDFIMIVHSIL